MGAAAFALLGNGCNRNIENWKLDNKLFDVAKRAVSEDRDKRQQSIQQLIDEWNVAKTFGD